MPVLLQALLAYLADHVQHLVEIHPRPLDVWTEMALLDLLVPGIEVLPFRSCLPLRIDRVAFVAASSVAVCSSVQSAAGFYIEK